MDGRHEQLEWNLTNHTPDAESVTAIEELRESAKAFGHAIIDLVPFSREQSIAITKLEEATMFAVAGIARFREDYDDGE